MYSNHEIINALVNMKDGFLKHLDYSEKVPFCNSGDVCIDMNDNHILKAIDMFLNDRISKQQLERWADVLECNEYIEFKGSVTDALFILSSPQINFEEGEFTRSNILALKKNLENGLPILKSGFWTLNGTK